MDSNDLGKYRFLQLGQRRGGHAPLLTHTAVPKEGLIAHSGSKQVNFKSSDASSLPLYAEWSNVFAARVVPWTLYLP